MGKGNRSRTDRAAATLNSAAPKTPAKKTDSTIKIVTALVALLLVFFIAVSVFTSTGIAGAIRTAAKSSSYRVDANLMNYFYQLEYQSYMQYASYMGIDTSKLLSEQTMTAGSDVTYADSIMTAAQGEVEQYLVLCEAAKEAGHKLSADEKKAIDDQLNDLKTTAAAYGYTLKAFVKAVYGSGVTVKTVRKALEIQSLASSYYQVISGKTAETVTEEEINKYFDEHKNNFLTADTYQYTYTAKLDTGDNAEATDEQKAAYAEAKTKMKELADKLSAAATAEDFAKLFVENETAALTKDSFSAYFVNALDDLGVEDVATFGTIKDEDITKAIAHITTHMADAEKITVADPKVEVAEGATATNEQLYTAAFEFARDSVLADLQSKYAKLENNNVHYYDPAEEDATELDKWLFADGRKEGDHSTVSKEGDTESTYTAVLVTRAASRDESKTRDVAHILFTPSKYGSEDAAKAEAEKILAEYNSGAKTLDAFKALGEAHTEDSGVFYEDVAPGDMVTEFNDWLFDEARKEGDVEIVKTPYGYHIMYFAGEGDAVWYTNAKSSVVDTKMGDWTKMGAEKYNVTFVEKTLKKIAAQY